MKNSGFIPGIIVGVILTSSVAALVIVNVALHYRSLLVQNGLAIWKVDAYGSTTFVWKGATNENLPHPLPR